MAISPVLFIILIIIIVILFVIYVYKQKKVKTYLTIDNVPENWYRIPTFSFNGNPKNIYMITKLKIIILGSIKNTSVLLFYNDAKKILTNYINEHCNNVIYFQTNNIIDQIDPDHLNDLDDDIIINKTSKRLLHKLNKVDADNYNIKFITYKPTLEKICEHIFNDLKNIYHKNSVKLHSISIKDNLGSATYIG